MNICLLSREYPPETHIGGIGTYTQNMGRALADAGHTVHVVAATADRSTTEQDGPVPVHRLHWPSIRPRALRHFAYARALAPALARINCKFDIIQGSEFGAEGIWLSIVRHAPLITRLATPRFVVDDLMNTNCVARDHVLNWMEKAQTLRSDGIFTSTNALASKVSERWRIPRERITVIPNSISISRVIERAARGRVPEKLRGVQYVCYFGRLEERKGVAVLAHALPALFDRYPRVSMVFVGRDLGFRGRPTKEYILQQVGERSDRCIFFDNLPQEELFPVVKAARLVVLPSLWEAFGFVCVEAMALGRPVIATSGSGFDEIVQDGVSGYLVEPGNSEALQGKMIACLADENALAEVASAAEKRARDFETAKIAQRVAAYFERVAADARPTMTAVN